MSISVQIRYFALVRDQLGIASETLELEPEETVDGLLTRLTDRHPLLGDLQAHLRIAVNLEFVDKNHTLQEGDEVALIPPVSGGQPRAHIRTTPVEPNAAMARVSGAQHGALVTFVGTVRDTSKGREVDHLEYEAYPEMAESKMEQIAAEIDIHWPGCSVYVEHRTGRLSVGEIAVVIAVGAPHREEAFSACRYMIDRIKEDVPIWKCEVGPDGSTWGDGGG